MSIKIFDFYDLFNGNFVILIFFFWWSLRNFLLSNWLIVGILNVFFFDNRLNFRILNLLFCKLYNVDNLHLFILQVVQYAYSKNCDLLLFHSYSIEFLKNICHTKLCRSIYISFILFFFWFHPLNLFFNFFLLLNYSNKYK